MIGYVKFVLTTALYGSSSSKISLQFVFLKTNDDTFLDLRCAWRRKIGFSVILFALTEVELSCLVLTLRIVNQLSDS